MKYSSMYDDHTHQPVVVDMRPTVIQVMTSFHQTERHFIERSAIGVPVLEDEEKSNLVLEIDRRSSIIIIIIIDTSKKSYYNQREAS